jgi:hypothetical protein
MTAPWKFNEPTNVPTHADVPNPKETAFEYQGPDVPTVEQLEAMASRAARACEKANSASQRNPTDQHLRTRALDAAAILSARLAELEAAKAKGPRTTNERNFIGG